MVGAGDVEAETRQVLSNLKAVLSEAGCTPQQVVRTTVFLADLSDFAKVNALYAEMFEPAYPQLGPAWRLPPCPRVHGSRSIALPCWAESAKPNHSKGEVDPLGHHASPRRQRVLPVVLAGWIHHQEVAICKVHGESRFRSSAWPEAQITGNAEAEGGNRGLIVELSSSSACQPIRSAPSR